MRRMLTTSALLIALALPAPAHASGRGPCSDDRYDVRPAMGHAIVARKVRHLIACAEERWPVPGGLEKALEVAGCESGFWPWAYANENAGVFQHRVTYWRDRVARWLRPEWFNARQWARLQEVPQGPFLARANVLVTVRMARAGGWSPWSCA